MSPWVSDSESIANIGTTKKTTSHRPPGSTRKYGVSRPRSPPISRRRDRVEQRCVLVLLGGRLERPVVVQLRQVGVAGEDQRAVRHLGQGRLVVTGGRRGVAEDDVLRRRYRRNVVDVFGQARRDRRVVEE